MSMRKNNMSKKSITLLLIALLFVSALVVPANAHEYKSHKLTKRLVFYPQAGFGDTTIDHFNQALWQWNKECDVYSLQRSLTTHNRTDFYSPTGEDQVSRIYHVQNPSDTAPGRSTTFFSTTTNEVVYANININTSHLFSNGGNKNSYDVWTVFIHEAGHVLGFGHCDFDSVMNVYPKGTIQRYLTQFDTSALNYKYK